VSGKLKKTHGGVQFRRIRRFIGARQQEGLLTFGWRPPTRSWEESAIFLVDAGADLDQRPIRSRREARRDDDPATCL
jgi:hypothetical protein